MFSHLQHYWKELQPYTQKQNYYFNISGDKISHQEYRFLRLFEFATSRWEKYFDSEFDIKLKIFKKHEITLQTARLIFNIPYILMMIFIGIEVMQGKHEIGFLIMANRLLNNIIDTCINIQNNIARSSVNNGFIKTWQEVIDFEENPEENQYTDFQILDFNNITYSYPQSESKALNGLNLCIEKGSKIAVVCVNGSGKTTFTNILCNLTRRFDGCVTADGKPINLNTKISCVIQDFAQYQLSIRDNIAMGNINYNFLKRFWIC